MVDYEKSGSIFVLRVFMGLNRIIEENIWLLLYRCSSSKKNSSPIDFIKQRFIKAILFWDVLGENTFQ